MTLSGQFLLLKNIFENEMKMYSINQADGKTIIFHHDAESFDDAYR